jgi:signal transduction histidine kinase/ligand-binding sensor domain-containing protein
MAFDADGNLWCLTDHGLYRGDPEASRFEAVLRRGPHTFTMPLLLDGRGRVWAGIYKELVLVERGQLTRWEPPDLVVEHQLRAFVEDPQGRIFVAHDVGLFEHLPAAPGGSRGTWKKLPLVLAPMQRIRSMWAAGDGVLWIGTTHGLIRYLGGRQIVYTAANGLRSDYIWTLHGDREGNLWLGTDAGPVRMPRERPSSWTKTDGLPDELVEEVIEARDGRIYVATSRGGFAEIVGGQALIVPGSQHPWFNTILNTSMSTQVFQDRREDWWVTTRTRIFLFRGPGLRFENGTRFGAAHGIREGTKLSGGLSGIHEDADGRIWIASKRGLFRYDPAKRGRPFFVFLPLVGFPDERDEIADVVSDRSGSVWLRTHREVARVVDGRIERLLPDEWLPVTIPTTLFADSRGRFWVGRRHRGLYMTAEPEARNPKWTHYTTANGLSSETVTSVAEDRFGRIYVGTPRGLDRLELETGRVRTFTTRDGLAGEYVNHVLRDLRGYLWVATRTGVTRLDPTEEPRQGPPPPVRFTRIRVAGEDLRLPERGVREIPRLDLGRSGNSLQVEFVGVSPSHEGSLRYQHRLDGIDADWSPPDDQRSVYFARLAPGAYRFLVRAVTPEGLAGDDPATLAFQIPTPFWQSRWFFVAAALALAGIVEALHRLRLRRRLELEAVRTRIATDLHDDIGSNLSRIAILSEVASRDLDGGNPAVKDRLAHIASVSRDLVDSMSDIVWAVNPARDRLRDLTQRMRHFADDILSARDIVLSFRAPPEGADIPLGTHTRRELFLVFKEAVNNIARHSGARSVEIELAVGDGWLSLKLTDDGHGFDTGRVGADSGEGNGLRSMQRRARALGGSFDVVSAPGQGTFLTVRIPLGRRRWSGRSPELASPSHRP